MSSGRKKKLVWTIGVPKKRDPGLPRADPGACICSLGSSNRGSGRGRREGALGVSTMPDCTLNDRPEITDVAALKA